MPLLATTWRPLIFTCLMIAQKVTDDICIKNSDFRQIYPFFDLNEVNLLESKFLQIINFDTVVGLQLYTKYYYELRSL